MKKVAIIMGSKSDLETVKKAADTIKKFGVAYEMRVISAHRAPDLVAEFAKNADKNGFGVIIAAAGMSCGLSGAIAAYTNLPVIALPLKSASLDGVDALLSAVMMPPGVPVACVAIDGAANAGQLAVQILAVGDAELSAKLAKFKSFIREQNIQADTEIQ
jgi:5-(carboxyamino)imidazole ribonucleotide mutase